MEGENLLGSISIKCARKQHYTLLTLTVQERGESSYTPQYLGNIYLFKLSNKSTRKMLELYSTLTIKTPKEPPEICMVNFEYVSHHFLEFL